MPVGSIFSSSWLSSRLFLLSPKAVDDRTKFVYKVAYWNLFSPASEEESILVASTMSLKLTSVMPLLRKTAESDYSILLMHIFLKNPWIIPIVDTLWLASSLLGFPFAGMYYSSPSLILCQKCSSTSSERCSNILVRGTMIEFESISLNWVYAY